MLGPDGSDLVVGRELPPLGFGEGRLERGLVHGAKRHRRLVVASQLKKNACERVLSGGRSARTLCSARSRSSVIGHI